MDPKRRPAALLLAALAAVPLSACSGPPNAFEAGEPVVLRDEQGVALGGYDPVSYVSPDGPVPGSPATTARHDGATYRFASEKNRSEFLDDPERYLPAYGGWCAWAVADGEGTLVEVNPRAYLIQDGRLLLFYDDWLADTRRMWLRGDTEELERRADRNWNRLLATSR